MFDIQVWKGNPIGYSNLTMVSESTGVFKHTTVRLNLQWQLVKGHNYHKS